MAPDTEILFVGALGRMEMEKIPAAGYEIKGIPIAGLQRRLALSNLKLPFLILKSMWMTKKLIREFKPDVVVGTGGYASGPLIRAAAAAKVPSLIQEQNSYAGITNKILSRTASKICVAYEGMEKFFPKEKIILTGNPVRQDLRNLEGLRDEAFAYFNLHPDKKTILVIGGSLGAKTINEAIGASLKTITQNNIQLVWQTGKTYFPVGNKQAKDFGGKHIYAHEFISRMDLAYAAADIVVSRAGASSVSELCNLGLPGILVPSPNVAEDHQTKNAMSLVNKGAAILVKDAEAAYVLVEKAVELINNLPMQEQLRENIKKLAFHDSATVIAEEVLKLAKYKVDESTRV